MTSYNNVSKALLPLLLPVVLLLASCNDFLTIYPTDKTIGEDFWKTKADVENMATGAYSAMIAFNVQERAIVWGSFRSDELVQYSGYSNTSLENISAVNLLADNTYNSWGDFYNVINRCNIVLNHAAGVMDEDPEFTQGDYEEVRAEMLALRSLCYFYLVRAFRDVPYTTQSYEGDDVTLTLPQSSADSVLQCCIDDLKDARQSIMKTGAYGTGDWKNKGLMTRDAVDALLADIYLWRASMRHDKADYEACVEYADKVIASKDAYYVSTHTGGISTDEEDAYHLAKTTEAWQKTFVNGNSDESILEWQYDGENNSNSALAGYYYKTGSSSSTSRVMASQIFNAVEATANTSAGKKVYSTTNDIRFWNNVFEVNNTESAQLSIRKFASQSVLNQTSGTGESKNTSRNYDKFNQNWIVYRLPDIMLMRAEALVQLSDGDDSKLQEAFSLVQTVNRRSLADESDSLQYADYSTKELMELLVMAERERELCFEGKRWFDIVRYCYRHMDGTDASRCLYQSASWPELPANAMTMVARKYESGGEAISYKMKNEPCLYFPIKDTEIKVNRQLHQNPAYETNNE